MKNFERKIQKALTFCGVLGDQEHVKAFYNLSALFSNHLLPLIVFVGFCKLYL